MKFIFTTILFLATTSYARITVEQCFVSAGGHKIKVTAHANQNLTTSGSATVISEFDGEPGYSSHTEGLYQYAAGEKAIELIQSEGIFVGLAKKVKASQADIAKGVSVYTLGNFSDDASGIVLIVFQSVKGNYVSAMMYGWAGLHICK